MGDDKLRHKILLCEDEINIVSFLQKELEHEGYEVLVALDGEKSIEYFTNNAFSLVLLDLMLPLKNGMEVLREIRKQSNTPVIVLTARKDTFDKVALINAGADDYVTKPFETLELLARIKRNIERNETKSKLSLNGLTVNEGSYTALVNDIELILTKTEFEILLLLMKNMNQVLTRDYILNKVYGNYYGESNVVDVNIRNIRRKIMNITDTQYITTIRGKGYIIKETNIV